MNLKDRLNRTKQTLIPSIIVFVIYGGLLLYEGLFLESGNLFVSLNTIYAGFVCIAAGVVVCLVYPRAGQEAVIICTFAQLTFLFVGTYLMELEFYFFFLIMLFSIISITKSIRAMLRFLCITLFINIIAFIFLFPQLEWLYLYRFFMQFAIVLFGAVFMLIQTYHISNKESRSDRALASFSALLQSTPNYMIIADANSRVRYISDPMVKFAGLNNKEVAVGRPLLDLFMDKKIKKMFADIFRAETNTETVLSIDIDGEPRHFRVTADKLTGDADGLFIDISDITEMVKLQKNTENALKAAEEANIAKTRFLEYNAKLATATNLATTYMLHSDIDTFNVNLHKAFDIIGKTVSVDRVYIWSNHIEDGVLCCTQLYEWSEGAEPQQGNELTVSVPYEALPYWGKVLSSNNSINSFVRNLPEGEREHLEEQDILSILAMPIFIDEEFWGFIGFDDCSSERVFLEEEETLLRSCGLLFAHAYQRNEMLKEIANVEERVQLMFDSTPLAVTLWNRQLEILDCNRNTINTFGYDSKADFIEGFAKRMPDFQPDGSRTIDTIAREITKAFEEGRNYLEEYTHLTKDDELLPLNVTMVRIKLRDDHAVVIYARDLREHKKMLEEMRRIEVAEQASKAKSQFLATISHEIRTPMNAILGITQMEMQDAHLPEKNKSALNKIYNSGNTLLGIINDILDMSKIESGKFELNPVDYDVPSLIHDTTQLNVVRIGSKKIEFQVIADENLPSRLIGDELRIKQILNNLLSNAFKYTDSGLVKLSISATSQDEGIRLKFVIEDTGQGLKPEDCKKLFAEEYLRFNVDNNRKTEGTGLGLNITKSLVDLMNGNITVESEFGKGSIFTVNILQQIVLDAPPIGTEVSEMLRNFSFSCKQESKQIVYEIMPYGKVLIVDDVDTNLYVAQGLMSPYELKIDTAISGFKAIEQLENNEYDIVFMDHMMPLMDGVETTKRLRSSGYEGTIIALTANAIVGSADMFRQNGFDDFISKPIDIRQLNSILNKWVRDKYPEQAAQYTGKMANQASPADVARVGFDAKLHEIFHKDAIKAYDTISETLENDDTSLFITTIHAMKAALANIGELSLSEVAANLEENGRSGDMDYVRANTPSFLVSLLSLIEKYAPGSKADDSEIVEDIAYLNEQLGLIKAACLDYDEQKALSLINLLKEKPWRNDTLNSIEEIRDSIYFESDFEGAAEKAEKMLNSNSA